MIGRMHMNRVIEFLDKVLVFTQDSGLRTQDSNDSGLRTQDLQ